MFKLFLAASAAALLYSAPAIAQDDSDSALAGFHIGVDAYRDSLEANQPNSTKDQSRNGFGGRAHAGYDVVVGGIGLIGAEIGIGQGGRNVNQQSIGGGQFQVNPGLTYDATARLGIAPGGNFAFYGRAGYRWLKTEQSITGQLAGNVQRSVVEKGFTYGAGAEVALSNNLSLRAEFNRTKFSSDLRQNKASLGASIRF